MANLSDDDLQLDEWLQLKLSQPHVPDALRALLLKAADAAAFAISDRPEIVMPWWRTIATRVRNGNQNCWRLTDLEGRARDEPQHRTPMGLTSDEGDTGEEPDGRRVG
jgi:hypothetical protein